MIGFPALVYLLCAATSVVCLLLLTRSYLATRNRLLLWSAVAFVGFALNNLMVFVDLILLPVTIDLLPLRNLASLAALVVLLYGFIWETS
ncbi:DUF5985 family protein [Sabulicella rubraurantiaca]|uniref:DUF5985 family protein n=1 Tax=Sabulicella rubraurantiaca TaxID=2811429 RepID=UPI001A95CE60|nr:DUF5985 family protein [Sabulicella rubraurantiaca]